MVPYNLPLVYCQFYGGGKEWAVWRVSSSSSSSPVFGDVLKLHLRWVSLEEDGGGDALVMWLRRWKKESGLSGWGTFLFKETSFGYNDPPKILTLSPLFALLF